MTFDRARRRRVLFVAPLFDEANRTRRFLVETMRRLDAAGIDSLLPDLPGCNESLREFRDQTLSGWRACVGAAIAHFAATSVLAVRGGALLLPTDALGWVLEPVSGASLLRQQLRARTIAAREEGRSETIEGLLSEGSDKGLELNGYSCGPRLLQQLAEAIWQDSAAQQVIRQPDLGGAALWMRAEPSEDPAQADALARLIAEGRA